MAVAHSVSVIGWLAAKAAKWFAHQLALLGIDVVSGGGDCGIMKAVCEGAVEAETEARSIGCTMKFPTQDNSAAIHKLWESWDWGTRLRLFGTLGNVYVCKKFGIGTLLEVLIIAQQLQFFLKTGYLPEHAGLYMHNLSVQHGWKPHIILVGRWWELFIKLLRVMAIDMKTISEEDLAMFEFAKDERAALVMVVRYHEEWRAHMISKGLEPKN